MRVRCRFRVTLLLQGTMDIKELINKVMTSSERKTEVIRYVIVGSIATAIQYGCYLALVEFSLLSAIASTITSYCISLLANFLLSSFFTFRTHPNAKKAASFVTSHMVNMGLQVALVALFTNFVDKSYAILPAMAICIPVNFFLVRFSLTSRYFK